MQVRVRYDGGKTEVIPAFLQATKYGPAWHVHVLLEREPSEVTGDYITIPLAESDETAGSVEADDGQVGCRWELVGSKEDAARAMMAKWAETLGDAFGPWKAGEEYAAEGLGHLLGAAGPDGFDQDAACWGRLLEDPEADLEAMRPAARSGPSG